jgi:hypothetical protein
LVVLMMRRLPGEMTARRFPPPWTIEAANNACFIVKDANGVAVSYVYFEDEPAGARPPIS